MRVLLPTLGSAGDVHPLLAIGRGMQARGHDAEIMTNPVFAEMVGKAGLKFHPIGNRDHYEQAFNNPRLWHPVDGLGVLWRRMARHAIGPVYTRIAEETSGKSRQPTIVVAPPLLFGARLAQEKLGVKLVSAYTAATMLRSYENPLTIAQWRVPGWLPRPARSAVWRALDKYKLEPMVQADLSEFRHSLGLPPLRASVFGQWMHSPLAGVTLFPEWFAPACRDWPLQVQQAGFPVYDLDSAAGLDPGLSAFLDQGSPPIVFTCGSAMGHGHDFFKAAVRSCGELGQRGIFLTTDVRQIPADMPPSIHHSRYAPFGLLFPRAIAVVHHGGIGTCAQALRAALPQLLTPMGFDQFDNAMRIEQLGVGTSLKGGDKHFASLTSQLGALLASPAVAVACRQTAPRFAQDNAIEKICDLLEAVQ